MTFQFSLAEKLSCFNFASQKKQLISLKPLKHCWPVQYSSKISFSFFLKIIKTYEWFALLFYSTPENILGQILQFSASQKNTSIKGIKSGKSKKIYAKIKVEFDALVSSKTARQIQEKLRNLKDCYKKATKNSKK